MSEELLAPVSASPALAWFQAFPASAHGKVRSCFTYAITVGATHPEAVVWKVTSAVGRTLDGSSDPAIRQLCNTLLTALRCQRAGALAYARLVLDGKGY
jgi:hypothetical protein